METMSDAHPHLRSRTHPRTIRPSGSAGRRSSAFVREQHAPIDARGRPALSRSAGYALWPLALDVERAFHPCDISTKTGSPSSKGPSIGGLFTGYFTPKSNHRSNRCGKIGPGKSDRENRGTFCGARSAERRQTACAREGG